MHESDAGAFCCTDEEKKRAQSTRVCKRKFNSWEFRQKSRFYGIYLWGLKNQIYKVYKDMKNGFLSTTVLFWNLNLIGHQRPHLTKFSFAYFHRRLYMSEVFHSLFLKHFPRRKEWSILGNDSNQRTVTNISNVMATSGTQTFYEYLKVWVGQNINA